MSSPQPETMSELYCVSETIENGKIMVTASPEIWVDGHILLWPPGEVDRSVPTPPQSDWTPIMCKVLKNAIATFDEAVELEKMYSKHRNSDSFREAQALKQLKRKHPVNENEKIKSTLIDVNSLVTKIKNKEASAPKNLNLKAKDSKYHSLCLEKNIPKSNTREPNKNKCAIRPPRSNVQLKSKNLHQKDGATNEPKKPRYENYLQSGKRNIVSSASTKKKSAPPSLLKLSKAKASSTTTKEQYLKENALTETEFDRKAFYLDGSSTPINENVVLHPLDNHFIATENEKMKTIYSTVNSDISDEESLDVVPKSKTDTYKHTEIGTAMFGNNVLKPSIKNVPGLSIIEDIVIKPARVTTKPTVYGNEQISDNVASAVLSGLAEIRNFFKQSEERRINHEARMQTQWELFVKKMLLSQGQNDGLGDSLNEDDDFDDLDANFPVTRKAGVEELDWYIGKVLPFKRTLKKRLDLLGGRDGKEAIRLKMKYLIADPALEHYTWRGTAEKRPFNKLTFLNDLIFKSVHQQYTKYTVKQYKSYMVEWVKHAKTRQRTVVYQYPNHNEGNENDEDDQEFDPKY